MVLYEKTTEEKEIFNGKIISVKELKVSLPDGKYSKREIVYHPGAVAIIALTKDNKIIMIRQFRKAVEDILWEIPAGKLEKGEIPLETAKRELEEETGFIARDWKKLGEFYTTPGFTNEIIHLFLAQDLVLGKINRDEDENLEVHTLTYNELNNLYIEGKIKDAKTLIAFLYLNFLGRG